MNKVIIIGQGLGLTGCQLIRLQEAKMALDNVGLDLIEAMIGLQKAAQKSTLATQDLQCVLEKESIIALSPLGQQVKEKKAKYIRQQHKLAQRHFRRK